MVFLPNGSFELLATGIADSDIREEIVVAVCNERSSQEAIELVARMERQYR